METRKGTTMKDESKNVRMPVAGGLDTAALPMVVDRATYQAELDRLRVREKAHTRQGDAIAAARRRLPMVEVDASLALTGPAGPVTLLDAFEERRQLIAYYFMWNPGRPAAEQCEGCTFYTTQVSELSYLHSRDITYAVFCQGPYPERCITRVSAATPRRGGPSSSLPTRTWRPTSPSQPPVFPDGRSVQPGSAPPSFPPAGQPRRPASSGRNEHDRACCC